MTREDYEIKWRQCRSSSDHVDVCEEYIKSLEQRIKELEQQLEPKTCAGCRYDIAGGYDCSHWSSKQEDCCVRFVELKDFYEPKDK